MTGQQDTSNYTICHIIYSGLGGHAAMLFSLLENGFFQNASHNVILAGVEPPLEEYITRLEALDIPWSYVGKKSGSGHLKFYFDIKRSIESFRPDFVFLNGLAAIPGAALTLFSKRSPKILLRESEPVQLKSRLEWLILTLSHLSADAIVHLTPEAAESAKEKLRLLHRSRKVRIIPNGLDTDFFSQEAVLKQKYENTFNIGMVSRLQYKKDHATLLRSFDLLRKSDKSVEYHLHIAGDGATRRNIEELVADLELTSNVTLHGMLDATDVKKLLMTLDLYVHSTFGETMSNSIMQAMSMGLPVIASDVQGVSNMVDNKNGLLCRSKDSKDLFEKMLFLRNNDKKRRALGRNAREYALGNFSITKTANDYQLLLLSLLSK